MVLKQEVESGFAAALNPILGTSLIDIPDSDGAEEFARKSAHNLREIERILGEKISTGLRPIPDDTGHRGSYSGSLNDIYRFAEAFIEAGGSFAIVAPTSTTGQWGVEPRLYLPIDEGQARREAARITGLRAVILEPKVAQRVHFCTYPSRFRDGRIVRPGEPGFEYWAATFLRGFPTSGRAWMRLKWITIGGRMIACDPRWASGCPPDLRVTPSVVRPGLETGLVLIYTGGQGGTPVIPTHPPIVVPEPSDNPHPAVSNRTVLNPSGGTTPDDTTWMWPVLAGLALLGIILILD